MNKRLKALFSEQGLAIDIMLLGMGDDGHTVLLFTGTDVLPEKEKWVVKFIYAIKTPYNLW